jgi:MFS family permease
MLASRRSILGLGSVLAACAFTLGLSLCVFSFSRVIWLSLIALFCAGASLITMLAGCNTVIQTLVDDTKRSRAMSFYLMAFMGMMPLGSLLAGVLADRFSAPTTVLLGGCAGIGISILYFHYLPTLRKLARPLYIQKGILPAESGTSAAADQDHTRTS